MQITFETEMYIYNCIKIYNKLEPLFHLNESSHELFPSFLFLNLPLSLLYYIQECFNFFHSTLSDCHPCPFILFYFLFFCYRFTFYIHILHIVFEIYRIHFLWSCFPFNFWENITPLILSWQLEVGIPQYWYCTLLITFMSVNNISSVLLCTAITFWDNH